MPWLSLHGMGQLELKPGRSPSQLKMLSCVHNVLSIQKRIVAAIRAHSAILTGLGLPGPLSRSPIGC
jgi:hypothetical protein